MIGTNTIELNQATMRQALEEYFAKRMPKLRPKVTGVRSVSKGGMMSDCFEVTLIEGKSKPEEAAL